MAKTGITDEGTKTEYYLKEGQDEGFTCCGMRVMTLSERGLVWLGAIGGFAGGLQSLMMLIPPNSVEKNDKKTDGEGGGPL